MRFINVPELLKEHTFARVAMATAEDHYREHQYELKTHESRWHPDVQASERGYRAVLEVLKRQLAAFLDLGEEAEGDLGLRLRDHLYNRCGDPKSPKDWDAWNTGRRHSALL